MAGTKKKPATATVRGITVRLDFDLASDFEVVEQGAIAADPDSTDSEKLAATLRVYRLIFGADYRRVKDELRAKNGGRLSTQDMVGFVAEVLEKAAELKNSGNSAGN